MSLPDAGNPGLPGGAGDPGDPGLPATPPLSPRCSGNGREDAPLGSAS